MKNLVMSVVVLLVILGCAGEQETGTTDVETAETAGESAPEILAPEEGDWWDLAAWDTDDDGGVSESELDQRLDGGFTEWDIDDDGALGAVETADTFRGFFDRNHDRVIGRSEWASGVERWDFETVNWGEWSSWDADGNDEVSETEWRAAWSREVWPAWDGDGDGAVSREALRERFRNLLDGDGDGVMSVDEWSM